MSTAIAQGSVRERLLAAANELFYKEGIHTVGIDRVLERAGVAKASLYSTFGSKDELVREYLRARHATRVVRITAAIDSHTAPRARLLAVFDALADIVALPGFRGCAFVNASAEGARDGVFDVCRDSRAWVRDKLVELATAYGARDARALAEQLMLLYDGAVNGAAMDRDPSRVAIAKTIAGKLVDDAKKR